MQKWNLVGRYTHWLHTMWPAGKVEKLPEVRPDGSTNVPGVYVVGDLTGVPLLKFAADTGARVVEAIEERLKSSAGTPGMNGEVLDLVIVGGGVAGHSAALEAGKRGIRFEMIEAAEAFATVINFPKGKPIFTYPSGMTPHGEFQFKAKVKEELVAELRAQTGGIAPRKGWVDRVVRRGDVLEVELTDPDRPVATPTLDYAGTGPRNVLRARNVILAIGRGGNHRRLDVPGEDLDKVYNRLHDPKDFEGRNCVVVGGGDSALETAIALAEGGAAVTLVHRRPEFSRAKSENVESLQRLEHDPEAHAEVEKPTSEQLTTAVGDFVIEEMHGHMPHRGTVRLLMESRVQEIHQSRVDLVTPEGEITIPNDVVFTMIGRDAPLSFFRRSGVKVIGEWRPWSIASLFVVLAICIFIYHWKKGGVVIAPGLESISGIGDYFSRNGLFPYQVPEQIARLGDTPLLKTLRVSLGEPGFYYSVAYTLAVVCFGVLRIRRRKTPYVKLQTITLASIQVVPLFLLPYIVLPLMGHYGWFDGGAGKWIADQLFPAAGYGHGREYWRAFGLILAWPLFIWNVFTSEPMWAWLAISFVQTFVIIPVIIYFWGKGAYCGWICSCGALAETLGDGHRHKMPHGPGWNRLNMLGQAFLLFAFALLIFRVLGWVMGSDSWPGRAFAYLFHDIPVLNYVWFVDLLWAGILGVGLYWHFSGRVWCRFACPLAALMHIYARFSRFRILAEKKKCISCNICTSVCHQGIDIMNFANKGLPMADPQCVRCSACIQHCPTGVLEFGQIDRKSGEVLKRGYLGASPVLMREAELTINGKKLRTADKRR